MSRPQFDEMRNSDQTVRAHYQEFDRWLAQYLTEPGMRRSVTASSFTASLELAREGLLELRQEGPFRPIYLKRRAHAA